MIRSSTIVLYERKIQVTETLSWIKPMQLITPFLGEIPLTVALKAPKIFIGIFLAVRIVLDTAIRSFILKPASWKLFHPQRLDCSPVSANALTMTNLFVPYLVILIDARGWSNVLALRKFFLTKIMLFNIIHLLAVIDITCVFCCMKQEQSS